MTQQIIKARAWDGSTMIYPEYAHQGAGSGVFVLLMDMNGKCSWNNPYGFEPEKRAHVELMLSTNLKDLKGKEIYRGDIVRDLFDRIMEVVYHNYRLQWKCVKETNWRYADFGSGWEKRGEATDENPYGHTGIVTVEVIGNIFENADLINTP